MCNEHITWNWCSHVICNDHTYYDGPYNGLLGNQIKDVIFGQSWDKTNVSANDKLIKEASLSDQAAGWALLCKYGV